MNVDKRMNVEDALQGLEPCNARIYALKSGYTPISGRIRTGQIDGESGRW